MTHQYTSQHSNNNRVMMCINHALIAVHAQQSIILQIVTYYMYMIILCNTMYIFLV